VGGERVGTVALVGAGEFLPAIRPLDRFLIDRIANPKRVAIVPTAAAPDGVSTFERWLRMGVEHFSELGLEAIPVRLATRDDADQSEIAAQIESADFVYLSGGKPRYLRDSLEGTASWQAIQGVYKRGGVVAGCSAGAMVLAGAMLDFPRPFRTIEALSLAPGILILPHFGEFPIEPRLILAQVSDDLTVVGVEGSTGLVGSPGNWRAVGRGTVHVFTRAGIVKYAGGQEVEIPTSTAEPTGSR
jgi:cyanophycinase